VGLHEYEFMGYLPETLRNYLLRLGWSHGDDEIISDAQAAEWFNLENIQKSPARFDTKKLRNLNAHYLRQADNARLLKLITPLLEEKHGASIPATALARIERGMDSLKLRAETLIDLADSALVYVQDKPATLHPKAAEVLTTEVLDMLNDISAILREQNDWTAAAIEEKLRVYAEQSGLKLGKVAQPLRVAITGTTVSPPIFEVAEIFGRDETLKRLDSALFAKA